MPVPPRPSLPSRLKQARVVQVLVVYLGAAWAVLQIADTLTDALSLPDWVSPVAVLLLLVGLVIILATAWVQSLASTTAAEEAGEIPTDWEIDAADVLESVRRGRMPHLTWGRAILGGVLALSMLFGGAGLYVLVTGGPGLLGPAEVRAAGAAEGIAVLPFEARGQDLEIWREGMVDLLANNLDGVGGYRTIDPRTVMARWNEQVGATASADLDQALRVAGATGARYALVGSVVGLGDQVRLVSNVYDLATGSEVAQGQAEGDATAVLTLVDNLAVGTMRSLLRATGREGAGDINAESLTTESLPALRHFLDGERHYRRGSFAEAVQAFERAVAEDSTFAIGLVRLSESYGWLENQNSEAMRTYGERAVAEVDRLPPRYQFLMTAWQGLNEGTADGLPVLEEAVQKYPDDPEAWFLLAETYIHVSGPSRGTAEDARRAIDRAIDLDPNFAPYLIHAADMAVMLDDREGAEAAVGRFEELTSHRAGLEHLDLAIPLVLGDSAEAARALEAARRAPARTLQFLTGTFGTHTDRFDRMEPVHAIIGEKLGESWDATIAFVRTSQGKVAGAERLIADGSVADWAAGVHVGHLTSVWDIAPQDPALLARVGPDACGANTVCAGFLAEGMAFQGRWGAVDSITRMVEERLAGVRAEGRPTRDAERLVTVVRGVAAFHRGRTEEARRLFLEVADWNHGVADLARLRLADLALAEGRTNEAERYFRSSLMTYGRPHGLHGLARIAEARGDTAEATRRWRSFVTLTAGGDAELVPRIREGREALRRLTGA